MLLRLCLIFLLASLLASACQTPALNAQVAPSPTGAFAEPTMLVTTPALASSPAPSATPVTPTETLTPTAAPQLSPTPEPVTTLLFTGVIVPARCVQAAIDASSNPDAPYEEVSTLITQADLAVGTLNATISDYPPRTGCVPTYVLVGGSANADALARAGFDVMSVATNHIKNCGLTNCGDRAFFDTLDNLRRVEIATVGAGSDHAEAMQPVVVTVNGTRFGIVSLGQIEPMAFASETRPGIAILNKENLEVAIAQARQVSDVVIAMPHWGPEDVAIPNWLQRNLAQQLVDAGADLVVGNHTHVVQAIQEIGGVPVFYGLGNFVFDQTWADDHQQGVILLVKFQGKKYLGYELIPTHVDGDGRVTLADEAEAIEIMEHIESASRLIK